MCIRDRLQGIRAVCGAITGRLKKAVIILQGFYPRTARMPWSISPSVFSARLFLSLIHIYFMFLSGFQSNEVYGVRSTFYQIWGSIPSYGFFHLFPVSQF